ncbi:hypothetical protein ACWD8L_00360 [Streptomyces sp. NPDC005133]
MRESFTAKFVVDPLADGRRVDLGHPIGPAYLGGCRVHVTLGNSAKHPIQISSMRIEVVRTALPILNEEKVEPGYGEVLIWHRLFVELRRNGFEGWWMLSDGRRLTKRRPISSSNADIFESPGEGRMGFKLHEGDLEPIDSAILARESGLYDVSIKVLAENSKESEAVSSTPIRICYTEEK